MTMSSKMVIITTIILPLLLFINTKQTTAQAPTNGRSYGLGGYAMDGQDQQVTVPEDARLLIANDDVKNYTTNEHADKQFKPCRVKYGNTFKTFEVFYDEETANEGCTVDFVFDKIDRISAMIALVGAQFSCLEYCGSSNGWEASSANLVPFTYSRSNEEIKTLHKGPPYNQDQTSCKPECVTNGGKCMASPTSLQFALNRCASEVKAWIHLVGEPQSSWSVGQQVVFAVFPLAIFDLNITTGDKPTITIKNLGGDGKSVNKPHGTDEKPVEILNCFTDDKVHLPIPVPQFWTINSDNSELDGKQLLVFHLLPQAATRVFNEKGQLQKAPAAGMPKCKGELSIGILNALGILQSVPPPPTTTQTATTSNMTATNETETTEAPSKGTSTLLIVGIVAATVLALIIVAILVYCLCCRNKDSEKDGDEDAEAGMGSGDNVENDDEAPE